VKCKNVWPTPATRHGTHKNTQILQKCHKVYKCPNIAKILQTINIAKNYINAWQVIMSILNILPSGKNKIKLVG
jgi:hypothetical protein